MRVILQLRSIAARVVAGLLVAAAALGGATAARAGTAGWAAPQIRAVTQAGILGTSPATFRPAALLTQSELQAAITATNAVQAPPAAPTLPPAPISILSTLGSDATVAGVVPWEIDVPGQSVDHVDFAVDGTGLATATTAPYVFDLGAGGLDTTTLADGPHAVAAKVSLAGGGVAIAVWSITVANLPGAVLTGPTVPVAVPIAKTSLPSEPAASTTPAAAARTLYRAISPIEAVTVKQLDAALVAYLRLGGAAREIQTALQNAGLAPAPLTGTEVVARMLGLRLNHPAAADGLELLPFQGATRAEAAWSFAQLLTLGDPQIEAVQQAADQLALPELTPWQSRILKTAVHYVGYPYIWGGTSPTAEVEFGVSSRGGFDCSGFVWRVYKLTPYPAEGGLAGVLRGRTTYVMSGEVPASERITAAQLLPGDVMFFGAHGPRSQPADVDHTAIYAGNGWLIQSSDEGVTLTPFDGWYTKTFAWARRPLREANL